MSGGFFDYKQYNMDIIADMLKETCVNNPFNYSEETIDNLFLISKALIAMSNVVKRADYLLSGDTGEEYFNNTISNTLL